jgi:hypothetical protein
VTADVAPGTSTNARVARVVATGSCAFHSPVFHWEELRMSMSVAPRNWVIPTDLDGVIPNARHRWCAPPHIRGSPPDSRWCWPAAGYEVIGARPIDIDRDEDCVILFITNKPFDIHFPFEDEADGSPEQRAGRYRAAQCSMESVR